MTVKTLLGASLLAVATLLQAVTAQAASEFLVSTDWLEKNLKDPKVRVIEVSVAPGVYERGHIPGAVVAAWASALAAGDFRPSSGAPRDWLRGGVLLGWGSLLALGCTVGTLLSGVMAGATSGWVFGLFCLVGSVIGLKLRPLLRLG